MQYFIDSNPKSVIYNQKNLFTVAQFIYPNQIINFQIDLNDSLKDQKKDLEQLYEEYHNESITDFKFMIKDGIKQINHTPYISKRNIYDMFFAFDAFLYGASINNIATILYVNNDTVKPIINDKTVRKYIDTIKSLLSKQSFRDKLTGRNVIAPEYDTASSKVCGELQTIARIY
ncbi:MAG: hypothetical protein DRG78_16590 [Epsilonproteobacteria bacterium]|nr:MAG: hypothetical protein DRG78_16590 [Campylobacterota bacterium]